MSRTVTIAREMDQTVVGVESNEHVALHNRVSSLSLFGFDLDRYSIKSLTMASSSKKSGKSTIVKRQASAKQAYKKNSKKGSRKAQNEQLLDLLDQNATSTIHDATNVRFLLSM